MCFPSNQMKPSNITDMTYIYILLEVQIVFKFKLNYFIIKRKINQNVKMD